MPNRITAFLIATLVLASLRAQFDALIGPMATAPVLAKLWLLAGFFTILTNLLVAAHLFAVARNWQMPASRAANLLVSILMVALIYHSVLAPFDNPQGLGWWANLGLHTAVPVAYLGWWLVFASKDVTRRDLPAWLIYPAVYCAYAVVRGYLTGFWPYWFVNGDAIGPVRLTINIIATLAAFTLFSFVVLAAARRLNRLG